MLSKIKSVYLVWNCKLPPKSHGNRRFHIHVIRYWNILPGPGSVADLCLHNHISTLVSGEVHVIDQSKPNVIEHLDISGKLFTLTYPDRSAVEIQYAAVFTESILPPIQCTCSIYCQFSIQGMSSDCRIIK